MVKCRFGFDDLPDIFCVHLSKEDHGILARWYNAYGGSGAPKVFQILEFDGYPIELSEGDSHPPYLRVRDFQHIKDYLAAITFDLDKEWEVRS